MKKTKYTLLASILMLLVSLGSSVSGNFTADNSTDTFTVSPNSFQSNQSVNQFGQTVENITVKFTDNSSSTRTFDISLEGNISEILEVPSKLTLFENQSQSFPVVANIPRSQSFGKYKGNISLIGRSNSKFSDKVDVSINVFDDIPPSISKVEVLDVQATESKKWEAVVSDNLNVSSVSGRVLRQVSVTQGNSTILKNETFINKVVFSSDGTGEGGSPLYKFLFSKTSKIGNYFLKLKVSDSSGNTVNQTIPFKVTGLNSISVLTDNFVFDTIRPKEQTEYKVLKSKIKGKQVTFSLDDLSYGGNETVKIGVLPPEASSPEILSKDENKSFKKKGVYKLVLIHTGTGEVKGTHRVSGSVTVSKPKVHVQPRKVEISFSGTVKNLDKPPETCERIKDFDSCIAYSLDQAKSMFKSEYGINDSRSKDFAYLIGRIPTSDVEGSDTWGDESSLTFGEYNETLDTNKELKAKLDRKVPGYWKTLFILLFVTSTGLGAFLYFVYPTFELDRDTFRERKIRKIKTGETKDFGFMEKFFGGKTG